MFLILPLGETISRLSGIFSYDSSVDSWSDWQLKAKLHEEKIVQLSWVYDSTYPVNSPFLGAHTEFVTVYYEGLLSAPFKNTVIKKSPFYYIRTDHYNYPNDFAIEHRNDCYVERISDYELGNAYFESIN